jgi:hypothetical protein
MDMQNQIAKIKEMMARGVQSTMAGVRKPNSPPGGVEAARKLLRQHTTKQKTGGTKAAATRGAFDPSGMIAAIRESIRAMTLPHNIDFSIIAERLAVCEKCEALRPDGCTNCSSCSDRWTAWKKHLIDGTCQRFVDPLAELTATNHSLSNANPEYEVNEMFVYSYTVTYTQPDKPDGRKSLVGVIAPDLRSAMETAEKVLAGATIIDAKAVHPVNAVASSVVSGDIEIAAEPQRRPGFGPQGPMMMGMPDMTNMG